MMKTLFLCLFVALMMTTTACQKAAVTPDLTSTLAGTYTLSKLLVGPTTLGASGNAVVTAVNKSTANVKVSIKSSSGAIDFATDYQVRQEGDKYLLQDGVNQTTIGTIVGTQLSLQITVGVLKYTGEFMK